MRHRGLSEGVGVEDRRFPGLQALVTSHAVKSTPGPPMTLGNAATARVRLICLVQGVPL
jgi:hypothetical protein